MILSATVMISEEHNRKREGYFFALGAYVWWGFFPFYWKLLQSVPSIEILCNRIVWSLAFYLLLIRFAYHKKFIKEVISLPSKVIKSLLLSAALVSTNWLTYIYAVNSGHILESSLGYFINPLVNVFLGYVVLGERLTKLKWFAVFLAGIGVANLAVEAEGAYWIPILLAFTFAFYGLIRKMTPADPLIASGFESLVLSPIAITYLIFFHTSHDRWLGLFGIDLNAFFLVLSGVATGLPLWWFTEAAVRIPLSTLGFIQFLAPTLQFLIAVVVYKEAFGMAQVMTFGFIWLGLLVFLTEMFILEKRRRLANPSSQNAS